MRIRTLVVSWWLLSASAACAGGRERAQVRTTSAPAPAPQPSTAPSEVGKLTEGAVVGYVAAVDESQRELAVLAKQKASSAEVKDYADLVLTQYRDAQRRTESLGRRPDRASAPAEHVSREAERAIEGLREQDARAFDRVFMATQIRAHRDVLATLEQRIAPSATTVEMKGFVASVRMRVAEHLARAEAIHAALARDPTSHEQTGKNPRR